MSFWLVAVLASLLLHGLFFWWRSFVPHSPATVKDTIRVTRISFQQETSRLKPLAVPMPPVPPQPVQEIVKPLLRSVVMPEPAKLKPQPELKRDQQTVTEIVPHEVKPLPPAKQVVEEDNSALTPTADAMPPPPAAPQQSLARQQYLQELFAHIESHKYYPAVARRRGLQGLVRVAFTVQVDGSLSDLQISNGQTLLENAARKSIELSLPLPVPAREISLPLTISFNMEFRLR